MREDRMSKPDQAEIRYVFEAAETLQKDHDLTDVKFLESVRNFYIVNHTDDQYFEMFTESTFARHKKKIPNQFRNLNHYIALKEYVEFHGYLATEENNIAFARAMSKFFGAVSGSRSAGVLSDLKGKYSYFQWSSWYPGYVQVSDFYIEEGPDISQPVITVIEVQNTGDELPEKLGVPRTVERFEGMGFARQNCIYFTLREGRMKTPKFCLIHSVYEGMSGQAAQHLIGFTLKGSNGPERRAHLSPIVLKRCPYDDEIESQAISIERCRELGHDDVVKRLSMLKLESLSQIESDMSDNRA